MDGKVFLITYFLFIGFSQTVEDNEFKTYNNYKWYNVQGSKNALEELKEKMLEKDNSLIYLSGVKTNEILIAPELNSFFLEISSKEKLNATLLHDDVSKIIR
ncbi:unnamed protein product, partial [Brenthis ino]